MNDFYELMMQAKFAVKDEYTFDFLEMGIEHSEQELEIGLINNIRAFLSEMGGTFAFIGNQYHIYMKSVEKISLSGAGKTV